MSLTWKDLTATVSIALIGVFILALFNGFLENIEARWALATLAVFLFVGLTGLVTGTARVSQRAWSRAVLYILSASALVITLMNGFFNSEVWLVALGVNMALIWLEFVGIDLFSTKPEKQTHITNGGAA